MRTNIIHTNFGDLTYFVTEAIWQYDYGQILDVSGIEGLPSVFEAQFSNELKRGETKPQIGKDGFVTIPNEFVETGLDIFCFIFLHATENSGETNYVIRIPVAPRSKPIDVEPTPQEQSVIDQAIAALNTAVTQTAADVTAADASAQAAAEAQGKAEDAQAAIENMTVSSQTLEAGSQATVTKTEQEGVVNLDFGIPKGDKGEDYILTTEDKQEISEMVGDMFVVNVSGRTPTIAANANTRYVCGELDTLDFTPSASGICDIIFTSGSTATVLTLPSDVKMPSGFSVAADTVYELNFLAGLGVYQTWAAT